VHRASGRDDVGAIVAAEQQLSMALPDTAIVCDADPALVTQIVTNLLANATRYTPRGGRIAVSAELDGGEAVISVRDTGIGIEPERLHAIFEKFVQAHSGGMGLGVGLTMVSKLAELHGGSARAVEALAAAASSR
jgi:signal transduction histidine kinase